MNTTFSLMIFSTFLLSSVRILAPKFYLFKVSIFWILSYISSISKLKFFLEKNIQKNIIVNFPTEKQLLMWFIIAERLLLWRTEKNEKWKKIFWEIHEMKTSNWFQMLCLISSEMWSWIMLPVMVWFLLILVVLLKPFEMETLLEIINWNIQKIRLSFFNFNS